MCHPLTDQVRTPEEVFMAIVTDRPTGEAIAPALLRYFQQHLGVEDLGYAEEPVHFPNGWEANVYHFQLQSRQRLPDVFTRPLIVRAYCSHCGWQRIQHEYDVQRYVSDHGYPAPRPLLAEESGILLGGPFMVMERIAGTNLFEYMLDRWYRIWWGPARMAETHVRLHQLPADGYLKPATPFLSRSLGALEAAVQDYRLYGLAAGLDWLDNHQPGPPDTDCILHLDFHPINLMFDGKGCTGVLDWSEADVGDRLADVATTLVLVAAAPVELTTFRQRLATAVGKRLLARWYSSATANICPSTRKGCTTTWPGRRCGGCATGGSGCRPGRR
jgi:aminoglycoside phosphotransferase (APT) family kinase protein